MYRQLGVVEGGCGPFCRVSFLPTELEARVNGLQGCHAVLFRHNTAGADFAGGDQGDVDLRVSQGPEHAPCRSGRGGHAGTDGADLGDARAVLERGAGPLGQQWCEGHIGAGPILFAEDETDVAAAITVLPLGLNDGVQADRGIRQGRAKRGGGARTIRHVAHGQLGLVGQGDTTDRLTAVLNGWIQLNLRVGRLEGLAMACSAFLPWLDPITQLTFASLVAISRRCPVGSGS